VTWPVRNYSAPREPRQSPLLAGLRDLPAPRVARRAREDPRNPNLLYLGASSFSTSTSTAAGPGGAEEPSSAIAFHDLLGLLGHPRNNDLVLGTHGRGISRPRRQRARSREGSWDSEALPGRKRRLPRRLTPLPNRSPVRPSDIPLSAATPFQIVQ
jgi:hypothetical protein